MFKRAHHQRIAQVLLSLDGSLLRKNHCLFGGGTVIALSHNEYRESVDIDFVVSDVSKYRNLRQLLTGSEGINAIVRKDTKPLSQAREIRADQYGIRTRLFVAGEQIKFEIILEGRIELEWPGKHDDICGIPTLTPLDMATCKLLANSDRWADDGIFSRDVIDLAMLGLSLPRMRRAVEKAQRAYGQSILNDFGKALDRLATREGWLDRCMEALAIDIPKAVLWQKIKKLQRIFG